MIPFDNVTPLAPLYVLLLGAILLLALGPAVTARVRSWIFVAINATALAVVIWISRGNLLALPHPDSLSLYPLIVWSDGTILALYLMPTTSLVGGLFVALLSVALAGHDFHARMTVSSPVLLLVLTTAAYGVLMAGTCSTLAITILTFESVAALWWVARNEPRLAVTRLFLGVITAAGVMLSSLENIATQPDAMFPNALLTLAVWLRLGFYPLLESEASVHSLPSVRLAWTMQHLAVGLYGAMWGVSPWILWPALVTALLHGTLAWVEPERERRLVHAAFASSGAFLAAVALGGGGSLWLAPVVILLAWLVLTMIPTSLGALFSSVSQSVGYLPPVVTTLSLCTLLVIGASNQEGFFDLFWNNGGPVATALLVVTLGGVLSSIYQFWQEAWGVVPVPSPPSRWRMAGIGIATFTLVLPYLVMWLRPPSISYHVSYHAGTWIGLFGSALWAVSLGYGRQMLRLLGEEGEQCFIMRLRMRWLLELGQQLISTMSGWLLRVRAVIEGEHYLAWALLVLICLGLVMVVYPDILAR
ncbi:MAG: hypothetical protein ACUVSF_05935 [Anaerolineae bacterium]